MKFWVTVNSSSNRDVRPSETHESCSSDVGLSQRLVSLLKPGNSVPKEVRWGLNVHLFSVVF